MTLQQLTFFVTTAKRGSFTQAADELYISQSSLSKSIMALEKEIGDKLFIRHTRHVRLSEAGARLLPHAKRMTVLYRKLLSYAAHTRPFADMEQLRIISALPLSVYQIIPIILEFEADYPDCCVNIHETDRDYLRTAITDNTPDIAFYASENVNKEAAPGLTLLPLATDTAVLAVAPGHSAAKKGKITFEDTVGYNFLQQDSGLPCLEHLRGNIRYIGAGTDTLKQYVLKSGAAVMVPKRVAEKFYAPECAIAEFINPPQITIYAAYRKKLLSPAAQEFLTRLNKHFCLSENADL